MPRLSLRAFFLCHFGVSQFQVRVYDMLAYQIFKKLADLAGTNGLVKTRINFLVDGDGAFSLYSIHPFQCVS